MASINEINELVGNKQFDEAKIFVEEALRAEPNDKELLKLAGLIYVNLELWGLSKNIFESVVKFDSDDATSWFYLANSYEKLGDFINAKHSYIKVIELRPEYFQAYKNLCIILLKSKTPLEAVEYAKQASKLKPRDYIYSFIIGTAYMKEKDFELALEYLEKALKKSPKNMGVLNTLGTCYMALQQTEDAINCYKKVIELYPKNPMAYFNLGSAYQIQNNHLEAVEQLSKAIELDDEDESFINAIAMSEVKLRKYADALSHYKQLALLCPGKENYKFNIVTCYEALGQYEIAIKMLEEMVYINPKYVVPAQKLASLYLKTNQLSKAKEIYDGILLKQKPTAEIFHQYAILSSSLCDTDTAERMLKKVLQMDSSIAQAHKDLGIIYLNKRLFDYAEEEFKKALELAPDSFEMKFEYANYLYSISKNTEAEDFYLEALKIQPNNVLALTFLGLNSLILNKLNEAKKYIMKAVDIEPNHEYVQFCAGRILYANREYESAKRYLISAIEQNPDVETQNTLALTYFELGEYNNALNIFKNIYTKNPQSVSVLMQIAKCYEQLGEKDNALEFLYKTVDIFPDNEDAHEMIRKLS